MSSKMLQFVATKKAMPDKRAADHRVADFEEIYEDFDTSAAEIQSSRCSQCGVPFCQIHCPLGNNIPDWLKLTAEGRLKEAYEISQSTNNMPEVCGRICPQDRLCEGNCVIEQSGHGTVTIGSVEKYITDTAWEKGWVKPIKVKRELESGWFQWVSLPIPASVSIQSGLNVPRYPSLKGIMGAKKKEIKTVNIDESAVNSTFQKIEKIFVPKIGLADGMVKRIINSKIKL